MVRHGIYLGWPVIMHSILYRDTRAVYLCIYWLQQGAAHPDQNRALRHALNILPGKNYESDIEWLKWCEGGFLRRGGKSIYPELDIDNMAAGSEACQSVTSGRKAWCGNVDTLLSRSHRCRMRYGKRTDRIIGNADRKRFLPGFYSNV